MLDVAVGHAGDVVGYGAGEALGGDFGLMVLGKLSGVGDQRGKKALDNLVGLGMRFFHDGRLIEVGVEELLGCGAAGFFFWAQDGEAHRGLADVGKRGSAETEYCGPHFAEQVGYQQIENAPQSFTDGELFRGCGEFHEYGVMEAAEERYAVADLRECENAGFEAVVEVGGEIGDFVGEVDELGFEGRELAEEIFRQLRMR